MPPRRRLSSSNFCSLRSESIHCKVTALGFVLRQTGSRPASPRRVEDGMHSSSLTLLLAVVRQMARVLRALRFEMMRSETSAFSSWRAVAYCPSSKFSCCRGRSAFNLSRQPLPTHVRRALAVAYPRRPQVASASVPAYTVPSINRNPGSVDRTRSPSTALSPAVALLSLLLRPLCASADRVVCLYCGSNSVPSPVSSVATIYDTYVM